MDQGDFLSVYVETGFQELMHGSLIYFIVVKEL